MLNPTQERGLRDKLANQSEHIARYQARIDSSLGAIDTYTVLRDEAIETQKELKKLLFEFSNLIISPKRVGVGEDVAISVDATNISSITDDCVLTLKINGVVVGKREVTLDSGETRTESQQISRDEPGTYEVDVNNRIGAFVVRP